MNLNENVNLDMAAEPAGMRNAPPPASLGGSFWRQLEERPYEHDLFQVLRWIDARSGTPNRLGRAGSPRHEPVRMRQLPHMIFAPSTLAAAQAPEDGKPASLSVYGFGFFGPNGPLPLHLTEYARERLTHHADGALTGFADLFHQRLILLFYRAWADAQSTASLDHPEQHFSRFLSSMLHRAGHVGRNTDSVAAHAKYVAAGHLLRQTRNPEGLVQILHSYFNIAVRVNEFQPRWIRLETADRLSLGTRNAVLGESTVLGAAVLDAQHAFRLELGPMRLADYMGFLPGRNKARQLRDWVREYVGLEFAWDARLVLDKRDVRGVVLGRRVPLGQASWLGRRSAQQGDAGDLVIVPESSMPGR